MILPTKHINFSQSLLGLGAYLLEQLETPKSVDMLWLNYLKDSNNKNTFGIHSFDNLILTILFLYQNNSIIERNGMIEKCI